MKKKERRIIGVISASTASMEQREIIMGIIENARSQDMDVVVLSNIYDPYVTQPALVKENCIYQRIASPAFDGFIMISEAIINPDLKSAILSELKKRTDVPVISLGACASDLFLPNFIPLDTDDADDFEKITDHLIDVHGYTTIDILTGYNGMEVSERRLEGYRRSLKKHGIPFRGENVYYGDFWTISGHELADRYISRKVRYPQALICCSDYMAYGFLDEFMERGIPLREKTAVIGYEYARERQSHTPNLTTYQRNRRGLGSAAVDILAGQSPNEITIGGGRFIPGDSCGCGCDFADIRREISDVQIKERFDFLSLFGQMEHRLTECRNINEFVACCWEYCYLIRNVGRLYMCLYESWYDSAPNTGNMIRYNLCEYEEPKIFHKDELTDFISGAAAPYFLCPLFYPDCELGYIVISYNEADVFDPSFRNWLKAVANALKLLRMKNDIRYLAACQNLSDLRDSLTSMYNEKGLKEAFLSVDKSSPFMVMLRVCLFEADFSSAQGRGKVEAIIDAAEAVRQFCGSSGICGRTDEYTFTCLVKCGGSPETAADMLMSVLIRHEGYMERYGMDSFACAAVKLETMSYSRGAARCAAILEDEINAISSRRRDKYYRTVAPLRSEIYRHPERTFDPDDAREGFIGTAGYLRTTYKRIYGVSFHQDCIAARMAKAKYLLTVSDGSVRDIAYQCGYSDSKYFMRQFTRETGMTAKEFQEYRDTK